MLSQWCPCRCKPTDKDLYPQPDRRSTPGVSRRHNHRKKQAVAYSPDGKCGPANNNQVCDPKSTVYQGTCCSSYGWCGTGDAYCGTGCLSGCTTTSPASTAVELPVASSTAPRSDGRCGKDFGGATCDPKGAYGGCCSSYGYCGSTPDQYATISAIYKHIKQRSNPCSCLPANGCQNGCTTPASATTAPAKQTSEPVIAPPTSTPVAGPTGVPTTDGTCGAGNGDTVCTGWPQGSCCSMYGFCGSTASHCGAGCQSGPCAGPPAVPAPGPSPAPAAPNPGSFKIVGQAGVPAMHAGLMPNGRVIFLDKLENYTQIKLADGYYAYSAEYDPATNKAVGLAYKVAYANTWKIE